MINYQILAECIHASTGVNTSERNRAAWMLYDAIMGEARDREKAQMQS